MVVLLAAAACRGGRAPAIMVYSPMKGSVLGEVARDFERRTGTHVDVLYGGSGEILSRIRAEREQPRGSVWVGAGGFIPFLVAKQEHLLDAYHPVDFDADLGSVPPAIATHDLDWNFVAAYVLALGWAYNPDRTPTAEVPTNFEALLDPKWRRQIEIADPASSGTSTLFLESAIQSFINNGSGEETGWTYLRQLAPTILRFPESGGAPAVDVGKGDVRLGLSFDQQAYLAKKEGAPIAFALPRETAVTMDPIAVIKGGPNPAAARQFVDYFLGPDAQNIIRTEGYFSLRRDVAPPPGWPYTLVDYAAHAMTLDLTWMSANFDRVRRQWREQIVPNAAR
ncbi:MAG TPA: extracellular solute-binding protein [Vicinamibacterales bacterium]|jgi:iron(III) transport system substrate-binding protein